MSEISKQKRPWSRMALPASILLNLFLLAVIGGHLLRVRNHNEVAALPLGRALLRAEAILSKPDAAAFGAVIRRDAPRYGDSWEQLQQARQQLNRQIVAEPFNPAATRAALQATQGAWDHFLGDFSDTLIDGLAQISPEGRHKLISQAALGVHPPSDTQPPK
jgi:uncharacterized membrane protein